MIGEMQQEVPDVLVGGIDSNPTNYEVCIDFQLD